MTAVAYDVAGQSALEQLLDYGLEVEHLDTSGTLRRVKHREDRAGSRNGWYVLHAFTTQDNRVLIAGAYGWWKAGDESHRIKYDAKGLNKEERQAIEARRRELEQQARQARAQLATETAERARKIWEKLPTEGPSAYLATKRIPGLGARFSRGTVVVPVGTGPKNLVGLQFIQGDGSKKFLTGMAKQGAYCLIGQDPEPGGWLGVAEGYATAVSCHLAAGVPVACAFDAGNLVPVVKALKARYPWARCALFADDDWQTEGNPGLTKAQAAAKLWQGRVLMPVFPEGVPRGTDWNDLQVAVGLEAAQAQAREALLAPEVPWGEEVEPPAFPGGIPSDNVVAGNFPNSDWMSLLLRNDRNQLQSKSFNVRTILEHDPAWKGVIAWCEFSARIMKRRMPPYARGEVGEWTDADDADLRYWLAGRYRIEPKGQDLGDAVLGAARGAAFHPVRDYLDALEWDGTERISQWMRDLLGAHTPDDDARLDNRIRPEEAARLRARGERYLCLVGAMFLIQSVARVRQPGCKADTVLILEGEQGRRKSTALRTLFGADWFSDTPIDIGSKDAYEAVRGLWCIEMAELDALNKADSTRAKAFFSSANDRYRPSYGRRAQAFPRQCVIAGTTNQHEYLRDTTGNRRYWPVRCERIDIEALASVRDQLWAEADWRYRQGEPWWPSEEDKAIFSEQQEYRTELDAWEALVLSYLHQRVDNLAGNLSEVFITPDEIMSNGLRLDPANMRKPEQTRVGLLMQKLQWERARKMVNGSRIRGYTPPRVGWGLGYQGVDDGPAF
jgi:putative DNA primase/helicase